MTVNFRGETADVVIDFDGGYEPDTNAHVIEWHFEGVTPEEHDALNLTVGEEQDIFEQLADRDQEEPEQWPVPE